MTHPRSEPAPGTATRCRGLASLAAVSGAALTLTGCGLVDPGYDAAAVSTSEARQYLPAAMLGSAAENMATPTVNFEINSSISADGEYVTMHAEGAMDPAKNALTMKQTYTASATEPSEELRRTVVANRVYLQLPGRKGWVRFTAGQARDVGLDATGTDPLAIADLLESVKDDARRMGRETVNDVGTTKYHAVVGDVAFLGLELESLTLTVYLAPNELPARVAINGSGTADVEGRSTPTSLSVTVDYAGWGDSVRIRAPKSSVSAAESGVLDELTRPADEGGRGGGDVPTV